MSCTISSTSVRAQQRPPLVDRRCSSSANKDGGRVHNPASDCIGIESDQFVALQALGVSIPEKARQIVHGLIIRNA